MPESTAPAVAPAAPDGPAIDGEAETEGPRPRPTLIAPRLAASASQRTVERTRAQLQQAEQALLAAPEVVAVVAPLVRHVNAVTEQLNEAQAALGRAVAERDAMRAHLIEIGGDEAAEAALQSLAFAAPAAEVGADRREPRADAAGTAGVGESKLPWLRPVGIRLGFVPEDDGFDALKRMARRRQLFAAVLLVGAFTALRVLSAQGHDFSKMSRDGLADLAYVGLIFQVFLMAWMLYRMVRVGGKGINWLFPSPDARKKRRR